MTRGLQPPVAAAAKVDGCFALDAFRDVDVELDAVVAHGDAGGAVDGGAACCAEDSVAGGSVLGVEGWGLGGDVRSDGGCAREGQHLDGVVDLHCLFCVYSEGVEGVFEGGSGGGGGGEGRVGVVLFYFFGRKTTPRILSNLRYLIALLRKRRAVPPTRTIKTRQTSTRTA